MLFQTPEQFAALALCLVGGWFLGLASSSGGRKWKTRLRDAEAANAAERKESARIAKEQDQRIRTLEKERDAALKNAGLPAAATATTAAAATTTRRGWFGWGRDNLSLINGIDTADEQALNAQGIKTYAAIETLTDEGAAALEDKLGMGRGRIAQQQWREQAALLNSGDEDEHARRYAVTR